MTRTEIINKLIDLYGYQSYLEIGVYNPSLNFNKIKAKKKTGVDPDRKAMATICLTSDEFFKRNKAKYDIIFIDGLHHADQVYRDIINSIDAISDNGTIVLHDCNPTTEAMQQVPRIQGEWTGDVWKAWVKLRSERSDITMTVLDTDYGVGIIRRGWQRLLNVIPSTYQDFDEYRKAYLNLVPVEHAPVSICIPAFEQYGHGVNTLTQLLDSISTQIGKFEVCISDNSDGDELKELAKKYKHLQIKYKKNPVKGISVNTNCAMHMAKYELIKVMYQDDRFHTPDAISDISFALKFDHWLACSGVAINDSGKQYKSTRPTWSDNIITGTNTIGMPSVTAWRKNDASFDIKLKTLLDCDFYYSLFKQYGKPGIVGKELIQSRYWDNSTSRKQGDYTVNEMPYIREKHGIDSVSIKEIKKKYFGKKV